MSRLSIVTLSCMSGVTRILASIDEDTETADELLPLVYQELRKLAAEKLKRKEPGQTIQATVLVHEAWLRLVGADADVQWNGRGHFFGAAARAMQRILVENARRKKSQFRLSHEFDWGILVYISHWLLEILRILQRREK